MANTYVKKIILFISILFLSNLLFAANLQYYVNQATNQTLHALNSNFHYQPSPLMDKAIEDLPAYSTIKKCVSSNVTDAILILKPILSYNPQSSILYGDLNVKVYQTRSKDQVNPDNFIKTMKISLWKVVQYDEATIGYYINEIYTDLLKKLTSEMGSLTIDKNHPTNGSYCDLLRSLKESSIK